MSQKIPRWVIGYAILQLVLAVLFGAMPYLNRGFQFPELVGNNVNLFVTYIGMAFVMIELLLIAVLEFGKQRR